MTARSHCSHTVGPAHRTVVAWRARLRPDRARARTRRRGGRRRLAEAGLVGPRHRPAPGRRRMPLLRLHPVEDDLARRRAARRGAARRRHGRPRRRRAGLRAGGQAASATRPPTTGTTRPPSSGSRARAARSSAVRAAWPAATRTAGCWSRSAGQTYRGRHVVVSTGTAPALPPIDGLAELRATTKATGADGLVWTNREAVQATTAPASLIVLGGGAIGCELAQGFARFGTEVTVVEMGPRILLAGGARGVRSRRRGVPARGHRRARRRQRQDGRRRRRRGAGHPRRRHRR